MRSTLIMINIYMYIYNNVSRALKAGLGNDVWFCQDCRNTRIALAKQAKQNPNNPGGSSTRRRHSAAEVKEEDLDAKANNSARSGALGESRIAHSSSSSSSKHSALDTRDANNKEAHMTKAQSKTQKTQKKHVQHHQSKHATRARTKTSDR